MTPGQPPRPGPEAGEYQEISYGFADHIAEIRLNAPAKRNRLSMVMRRELVTALGRAGDDDGVRVVVISAAGQSFCSGYDLAPARSASGAGTSSDSDGSAIPGQFSRSCLRDWMTIWNLPKPVAAIVHGHCLAGGTELMSMCDIVFAADDARIGYPAVRSLPAPHVPWLPWRLPMAQAKYLQLTGTSMTGAEAAAMGLVAKSFPAPVLRQETFRHLRPLAQIPARLLASNKRSINEAYELMGMHAHLRGAWKWHAMAAAGAADDEFARLLGAEGVKAAVEWRDGPFRAEGLD